MIEIFGPTVSPFVIKVLAAADYKGLTYTHTEHVSIRELSKLNPGTGFKEDVTPDFTALVSQRPALADWYKRTEDTRQLDGGPR